MTSKRINSTNQQIIELQEPVLEALYFILNGQQSFAALVSHKAVVYTWQDRKYEQLYSITSGDIMFTCFDINYVEGKPELCIGTNFGQLMFYDLTLSSANFISSQIVSKAKVFAIACTQCGIYAQVGSTLFNYEDGEAAVFRNATQAKQIAFDNNAFLLYTNTRYKKINTVIAYDLAGVNFYVVDRDNFHSRSITAFCIDPATDTLITGDQSGMCVVWNVGLLKTTGAKMIYCFKEGNYAVASLHFSTKYLLIFVLDVQGNAVVYDANRKIVIRRWGCNYQNTAGAILQEQHGEYCTYDYNSFVKFWNVWDAENTEQ